jgi:hypothetical protein
MIFFYTSINNIQFYTCIKIYRAGMDVYATFMHPYKRCLKYTNSFIRVLGGTHSGVYFFVNIKKYQPGRGQVDIFYTYLCAA